MDIQFLQALQAKIGARLSADRDKSGFVSLPVDGGKLGIGCGHLDILLIVVVVFSQEIEKLVSFVVGIQFAVAVASTAALVRILDCRSTADWRCRTCGLSPLSSSVLWCTSTLLLVILDVMSIVCNELLLLDLRKRKGRLFVVVVVAFRSAADPAWRAPLLLNLFLIVGVERDFIGPPRTPWTGGSRDGISG